MKVQHRMLRLAAVAVATLACLPVQAEEPRLILQITVDQLRAT